MKKYMKNCGIPFVASVLSAVFPTLFLYCNNAEEAAFSEIMPAMMIFAAVGVSVFCLALLLMRSWSKAAILAVLINMVMLNYALLENGVHTFLPNAKYWHIVPVLLHIIIISACLIKWFMPEDFAGMIGSVLCLVFAGLSVVNIAVGIPGMFAHSATEKQLTKLQTQKDHTMSDEYKPNIYLLIFDEYAGFSQISEYFNYDNVVLKEFFEDNNFSVSYTSQNESAMTTTVLTNLANIDYVVDNDTGASDKSLIRTQGALFTVLRENGYTIQGVEASDFFNLPTPVGDGAKSKNALTAGGNDLTDLCILQTVAYPFYHRENEMMRDIMENVQYLSSADSLPERNTFTLAYFCFPHEPFLVDENGNPISAENYHNWKDKEYYLGQYKYATKLMMQMAENILKNDKDSILIIQSDHGARASTDEEIMATIPYEVMKRPLNAVYYRNEHIEIEGLSSVNTMRTVLNKLLSESYEMLDVPKY